MNLPKDNMKRRHEQKCCWSCIWWPPLRVGKVVFNNIQSLVQVSFDQDGFYLTVKHVMNFTSIRQLPAITYSFEPLLVLIRGNICKQAILTKWPKNGWGGLSNHYQSCTTNILIKCYRQIQTIIPTMVFINIKYNTGWGGPSIYSIHMLHGSLLMLKFQPIVSI